MTDNKISDTSMLFYDDQYRKTMTARIIDINEHGVLLNKTVFYPEGGGQPGDIGKLLLESDNGEILHVVETKHDPLFYKRIRHKIKEEVSDSLIGATVIGYIDWNRRYKIMKLHSCIHMLCSIITAPVTGAAIRDDGTARLDFNLPNPLDKEQLNSDINHVISKGYLLEVHFISDDELKKKPDLVRTMSVKPPVGLGQVRLIEFKGADIQPCGGTHISSTKEIGKIKIQSIKKKGKLNRRITLSLA